MSDRYLEKASSEYQAEWDRYDNRVADGCIAVVVLLSLGFATKLAYSYESRFADVMQVVFLAAFALFFFGSIRYFNSTKCPRCGKTFMRPKQRSPWEKDDCDHCELPLYYGSKKYIDLVGVEKARAVAERIERSRVTNDES